MTNIVHATSSRETALLPSMDREQTVAFLQKHQIFSLGLNYETYEKFEPNKPFLYVFEDTLPIGVFELENPTRRPSIARIDNPTELKFGGVLHTAGQIDYYAIDPETEEIFWLRAGGSRREYKVGLYSMPYLFSSHDALFPKGPPVEPHT